MPTRREVIRFDAEPIKVRLDKGPHAGIECHGEYGIDWRYSVNHEKAVIYLPTEGRDALVQCGAEAGDEVAIRRLGRNRWEAERIARELPLEPEPTPTEEAEAAKPGRSAAQPLPDRLYARPEAESKTAPGSAQPVSVPAAVATTSQHMMACYCVAVDVAVEVQEYARKKGINIAFTGSDIRAMGITVYIGDNQRLREAS
jgi:hypothetical protein